MPFPNPNVRLYLKQRISSILTFFWNCTKKDKIKYCRKFIFMIDAWKNTLKDPFFFVKLDHNNSYNLSKCRPYQGGAHLVLVCNFSPANFDFVFFPIFPSCIVQISFHLNYIAYSLHRYVPYHPRKGWKKWRLVSVLVTVQFTVIR